jgi:hypothetical protein
MIRSEQNRGRENARRRLAFVFFEIDAPEI